MLMRRLRGEGVGIIFVTHFLEQVYAVCDRITVLRNGELVGEYETKDLPRVMLVAKMMGKDFDDLADSKGDHKDKKVFSDTPVIEAKGIGHKGTIKPFDLKINKGEVFTKENLVIKRPNSGIDPMRWDEIIGRVAVRDFAEDELIEI